MSVETLYQAPEDERPVFRHSLFTVGVGLQDGCDVVVIHATMGQHKFEFRLKPAAAREIAATLIARANLIE